MPRLITVSKSLLLLLTLFLVACNTQDTPTTTGSNGKTATVLVGLRHSLVGVLTGDPADLAAVTSMTLTVSARDMSTLTVSLPLNGDTIAIDVPAGVNRVFSAVARDASNVITHRGSTTLADLIAGSRVRLNLTLDPVGPDTTAPTVIGASPADGATGVAISSTITVTFSEAMDPATINDTTFIVAGATGTLSYSGTTAMFTPDALANGTSYTVTITTGVTDVAGNALAADYTFSFTTVASGSSAPTFSGLTLAVPTSSTTVDVAWELATDDVSASDAIVYDISVATSSGAAFNVDYTTAAGASDYTISGLTEGMDYYIVVRARDEAGNSDTNTVEAHVVPPVGYPDPIGPPPTIYDLKAYSISGMSNRVMFYYYDFSCGQFTLDFGDGVTDYRDCPQDGGPVYVEHVYTAPGTYTVTLSEPSYDVGLVQTMTLTVARVLPSQAPSRIVAGGSQSMAVRADGLAYSWGTNNGGVLGTGATGYSPTPIPMPGPVYSMDGKAWYSVALEFDGSVWGWGWGSNIGVMTSALSTFQAADAVIGQADFTGASANRGQGTAGANTLSLTAGSPALGMAGGMYVVDRGNNRILGFNTIPTTSDASADFVIGQASFTDSSPGTAADQFDTPNELVVADGKLFVADWVNNRVLIWNTLPTGNTPADVVVGNSDFTSVSSGAATQTTMEPFNLAVANGHLFVSDPWNNRVLIWNFIPTANGEPANVVLGQPDFTSNSAGLSASAMILPHGVWSDGVRLVVCDSGNNRVLIWNSIPTVNNTPADVVIGQPNFTSNGADFGAQGLNAPTGVEFDGNQLFVADANNNRVLVYNGIPGGNGASADAVLGQSTFTNVAPNDDNQDGVDDGTPSARTFNLPITVRSFGHNLYVSEYLNNRVLMYRYGGNDNLTPDIIPGLSDVIAISSGYTHTLALRRNGTVFGFGSESYNMIGTPIGSNAVRQIGGLEGIIAVAAGEQHSLALKSDGTVLAWGNNNYGQLGDNTTTAHTDPAAVTGLSNVVAIAAGSWHSVALKADGTVWTWGYNWNGQLGDTTYTDKSLPVQVLSNVTAISTGNNHTLALMNDGTVMSWGYNADGQLGDNSTSDRNMPVAVSTLSNVVEVDGGEFHSIARLADGTVWAWGRNSEGVLGDGTTTDSYVPIQVSALNVNP